ncbi:MAG: hypothetical protein H3C26_07175 [Rhodocyclaceae bacterium]|nr:hypothetical protein [Rhodocyclaceae bacterium]
MIAALLCLLPLQGAAATDYHMCYSPGTQAIVFKAAPCAPGMTAQPSPDYPRSGFNPEAVARCEAEAAMRGELAGGTAATPREKKDKFDAVQVGMTSECVRQVLGEPSEVNAYNYGGGPREQWIYRTGKFLRDHYVYIRAGRVSSLSLSR